MQPQPTSSANSPPEPGEDGEEWTSAQVVDLTEKLAGLVASHMNASLAPVVRARARTWALEDPERARLMLLKVWDALAS